MKLNLEKIEVPEGWTKEEVPNAPQVALGRPRAQGGGFVTIDFERRSFGPGYGGYPSARYIDLPMNYAGRGWKRQIVADAVAWLTAV